MHVFGGRDVYPMLCFTLDRFLHRCGYSGRKNVVGNLYAFADNAARGNQRAFSDDGTVEQYGITPDKRMVLDMTIFHYSGVADRNVVVDLREMCHMDNGVVLYGGASADANRSVISAQYRSEPNARFLAYLYIADKHGGRRYKSRRVDFRPLPAVLDDHVSKS